MGSFLVANRMALVTRSLTSSFGVLEAFSVTCFFGMVIKWFSVVSLLLRNNANLSFAAKTWNQNYQILSFRQFYSEKNLWVKIGCCYLTKWTWFPFLISHSFSSEPWSQNKLVSTYSIIIRFILTEMNCLTWWQQFSFLRILLIC